MKICLLLIFLSTPVLLSAQSDVAVVELFTSQGCSSCPSADRLLTKLMEEAEADGKTLFPLSFHVSYWNYLGWKDPYSNDEFTKRQHLYASRLKTSSVYTPQMIVNGKYEFVGSDANKARSSIKEGRQEAPLVMINLEEVSRSKEEIKVDFDWEGPLEGYIFNVALVERSIENYVPRGENHGKTLHHDNVVRYFNTYNATRSGSLNVSLPEDANLENCSVVIYAQEKRVWTIVGATALSL